MCGIFSLVLPKNEPINKYECNRILSLLSWRGPDSQKAVVPSDNIYLGQTILSLTGKADHKNYSHLVSKSSRYTLLFNGEVYNYKQLYQSYLSQYFSVDDLDSLTDSEVLVNLFERFDVKHVVQLLDGMFAFVLYDKEAQKIYLARDVQGEKSLYYHWGQRQFVVSSQINTIKKQIKTVSVNKQVLENYLHTRHFIEPVETVYQGIRQIQPGEILCFAINDFSLQSYHQIQLSELIDPLEYKENLKKEKEVLKEELNLLLRKNLEEMLPKQANYTTVCSGGIDSSLVSALLVRIGKPSNILALEHPGKDVISNDLRLFEEALKLHITTQQVTPHLYAKLISNCQKIVGEPLHSHSFVGQYLLGFATNGFNSKVLFGGEGADEIFGGYDAYRKILQNTSTETLYEFSPSPYSTFHLNSIKTTAPTTLKDYLKATWKNSLDFYSHVTSWAERVTLAAMYSDLTVQLPHTGLRGTDLMTTSWGVETRSLFLRKDVLKFALNLPLKFKVNNNAGETLQTKALLKSVYLEYFPLETIKNKQGFAGFPSESSRYLGDIESYQIFEYLDLKKLPAEQFDKNIFWKLINLEYFIRNEEFL